MRRRSAEASNREAASELALSLSLHSSLVSPRQGWLPSKSSTRCSRSRPQLSYIPIMAPPHRSQPRPSNIAPRQATDCALYFAPRGKTQPLYRPAALRRSSPAPAPHQQHTHVSSAANSPPASPSLSVVETKSSWLGSLPWSPAGSEREFRFDVQPTGSAAGTMLPKSQWRVRCLTQLARANPSADIPLATHPTAGRGSSHLCRRRLHHSLRLD